MASAIDPSVIGAGNVDKAAVRLQLERARDEITALENTRLLKAGDTMAGDLTISKADPRLVLDKTAAGQTNYIVGRQGGSSRWGINIGGPTTSDFSIDRYNDSSAYVDTPLSINRATGAPSFASPALWRTGLGAPPIPIGSSGVGQFTVLGAGSGLSAVLPAGGTWAYYSSRHFDGFDGPSGGNDGNFVAGVQAGGTIVGVALIYRYWFGFCWRIT